MSDAVDSLSVYALHQKKTEDLEYETIYDDMGAISDIIQEEAEELYKLASGLRLSYSEARRAIRDVALSEEATAKG